MWYRTNIVCKNAAGENLNLCSFRQGFPMLDSSFPVMLNHRMTSDVRNKKAWSSASRPAGVAVNFGIPNDLIVSDDVCHLP